MKAKNSEYIQLKQKLRNEARGKVVIGGGSGENQKDTKGKYYEKILSPQKSYDCDRSDYTNTITHNATNQAKQRTRSKRHYKKQNTKTRKLRHTQAKA